MRNEQLAVVATRWATRAAAVTPLLAWPGLASPVNVVKLSWLVVCAGVALAGWLAVAMPMAWSRPLRPVVWSLGAFVVALIGTTLVSADRGTSLFGLWGRSSGTLMYLALAALAAGALWTWTGRDVRRLAVGLQLLAAVLAGYGLLQALGADPIDWVNPYNPVIATLGNPNFFSGATGLLLPVVVASACRQVPRWLRAASLVQAVVMLGLVKATGSVQGLFAAAVGAAVFVAFWMGRADTDRLRRALVVLGATGALAGALLSLGAFSVGPADRLVATGTLRTRQWYWSAAAGIAGDHLLVGVGPGMYARHYRRHKPDAAAQALGVANTADDPHNVPLAMLVGGGLPLLAAYLAIAVAVLRHALHGIIRIDLPERRILVGGLLGAWAAYHVQSLVSLDTPALSALHFLLIAGVVVGTASPSAERVRKVRTHPFWVLSAALAMIAAIWGGLLPLRAEVAAARGAEEAAQGDSTRALASWRRAAEVGFWEGRYPAEEGRILVARGLIDQAAERYAVARRRDPDHLPFVVTSARLAAALDRMDEAELLYREARKLDPRAPELMAEYGMFLVGVGEPAQAVRLLIAATRFQPGNREWLESLGRAAEAAGEPGVALTAYRRLLDIEPNHPPYLEAVKRVEQMS